jgi:hypothetical protein
MKIIKIILIISIFMLTFSQPVINTEAATITRPSLDLIAFFNNETFSSNLDRIKYKSLRAGYVKSSFCKIAYNGACADSLIYYDELIDAINNKISFNNFVVTKLRTGVVKFSLYPVFKNIQRMNYLIDRSGYGIHTRDKNKNIGPWWWRNGYRLNGFFEVKLYPPIYK